MSFRLPLGLQMICATMVGLTMNFFPFSPRWLAMVDRPEDALQNLAKLRSLPPTDMRIQTEFREIMMETQFQRIVQERRHPGATGLRKELLSWGDLFQKKMWRRLAVGAGVQFFQQFSGINAFIYYAPTLFESLGQTSEMSLIMSGIFNVLQLVAITVCLCIIDKVGRRPLAIWGAVGTTIAWTVMAALVGTYSKSWLQHPAAGWGAVAMAFLFILVFGATYSPLGWALPTEVFPSTARSKGVALATAVNWLGNFTVGVITPPMIEKLGFGTYVFFGAWCALAVVWAYMLVPETKGKTLEQMDEVFGDHSGSEEMQLMRDAAASVLVSMGAPKNPQV